MESLYIVNSKNKTKLFTESNLVELAKQGCRIIYAIVSKIPNCEYNECSTIGISLTPSGAIDVCDAAMGDFIEVWVIGDTNSINSEKWEPKYFKKNFTKIAHIKTTEPSEEHQEEQQPPPQENYGGDEEPDEAILHTTSMTDVLRYLFKEIDRMRFLVQYSSYTFGYPMDVEAVTNDICNAIGRVIYKFLYTTSGHSPKVKKTKNGPVPYWTKKQIESARMEGAE